MADQKVEHTYGIPYSKTNGTWGWRWSVDKEDKEFKESIPVTILRW